jgi:hypothetical protein
MPRDLDEPMPRVPGTSAAPADPVTPVAPAGAEWVAGPRGPHPDPASPAPAGPAGPDGPNGPGAEPGAPLLTGQDGLRERWLRIQSGFVDDPRVSVTEAAGFVGELAGTIVTAVQEREQALRDAWDGEADTEQLRKALREYRTFFELLANFELLAKV